MRDAFWAAVFSALVLVSISFSTVAFAAEQRKSPISGPKLSSAECRTTRSANPVASLVDVSSTTAGEVAHGGAIDIAWQLPPFEQTFPHSYLIGAMPNSVRFEGNYQFDQDGNLAGGPGFIALPPMARAPFGIATASDRTRVVIPINDPNVNRTGGLRVKSYVAGRLIIDWAVVTINSSCPTDAPGYVAATVIESLGPFEVAPGAPEIVVQDFVTPDPLLEVAQSNGAQRLIEVETSKDGRYRLEIFPRRYRVFDRASGAKVIDRSGVKARFSPSGRFLVASVGDAEQLYPTNLEVVDLIAGKVVGRAGGPIIGWSNGDALMIDAGRAYQSVSFVSPLIDPVQGKDGTTANWIGYFPGCGTCDAWASSNIWIDWDRLSVLRTDGGVKRAMGIANFATARKFETSSFGDEEAHPLEQELRKIYGRPDVPVQTGWTSGASLNLTHPGRGYDGYTDDEASLKPSEAGRRGQQEFLAPRRLALANGQILLAQDLRPSGAVRGEATRSTPTGRRSLFNEGSIDSELTAYGLKLTEGKRVEEIVIPVQPLPGGNDPLVRTWPADLKTEVVSANPTLKEWFKDEEFPDIIVAGWRFKVAGVGYLLMQHGSPAMTSNGAHDLSFDLLTLDGTRRGAVVKLTDVSGLYSQFVGRDHTVARVSVLSRGRLVVAVPGTGRAVIISLDAGSLAETFDLVEPTLICGVHEVANRDLIVQGNCDGQLFVFDPNKGPSQILLGRVVDNELILYTSQGFYSSTYEGAHFVHVTFPGLSGVHSFEQFSKVLERPDVIFSIISGHPLNLPSPDISPPPEVQGTLSGNKEILAEAQSSTGLALIELYEDGKLTDRQEAGGSKASIVFRDAPPPHVRGFSVVATDAKGFRSRPAPIEAPTSHQSERRNVLHVIAVGVDAYDNIEPLTGARFDAERLVAELQSHAAYYRAVKTVIRVDHEATPQVVMNDLRAATAEAAPDDTVLFFFAGHGGRTDDGRYFMAVSATDTDKLPETAIDWQQAAQVLSSTKGRVIAILDACHSGQTAVAPVPNDGAVASLAQSTEAPMVVLAASKGRQLSEEAPSGAGGIFTQTLATLLGNDRSATDTNGDGVLQISEIYRKLRQSVDAATEARQTPWLVRRNIVGDAPLF